MQYYARIVKSYGSFLVTFPGLPGCLTEGRSIRDAIRNAKEALNGYLAVGCDRGFPIPRPRKFTGKNYYPIDLEIDVEFAIQLRRLRKKRKMSQSQLAKKLGISQQAYSKFESPGKTNPTLSTIQRISDALGAEVTLKLAA